MKITRQDKKFLLNLSRKALTHIFKTGQELSPNVLKIPKNLKEEKATFITLTKKGELRGCIGNIKAVQEIYKDVIRNTYSAAFGDPRFPQLSKEELDEIVIEISILDKPLKQDYKNPEELINKLQNKPGVILEYGLYTATFLPQVWEDLSDPEQFLSHLSQKAGLPGNFWKEEKVTIYTYKVTKFSEGKSSNG